MPMAVTKKKIKKDKRTKKDMEAVKHYAFILYMQNIAQKEIATRSNVAEQTVSEWKRTGNWEAKRAAKTISIDELIVKALGKINEMLDEKDFNADAFAKAVAQLKTLKQRNTVDDEIMCFMDFQNFLLERRQAEGLEDDFLKRLTKLQDYYIQFKMGNG
jgi:transcriptional regulator with XRE-family HTH domain